MATAPIPQYSQINIQTIVTTCEQSLLARFDDFKKKRAENDNLHKGIPEDRLFRLSRSRALFLSVQFPDKFFYAEKKDGKLTVTSSAHVVSQVWHDPIAVALLILQLRRSCCWVDRLVARREKERAVSEKMAHAMRIIHAEVVRNQIVAGVRTH